MLFFVDESWQKIGDVGVGALGAVAIKDANYNAFCREIFRFKRDILGATELNHSEIRGQHAFTKAVFKRESLHGDSYWLDAVDALFQALRNHGAKTFIVWTDAPDHVDLRNSDPAALSDTYKELLFDFRHLLRTSADSGLGSLNFDQRSFREDETAGCAIQNYIVRTHLRGDWRRLFIQVPNFTVSSVSPGLQAADVVAHLGAHLANPGFRPELQPYVAQATALAHMAGHAARRKPCVSYIASGVSPRKRADS